MQAKALLGFDFHDREDQYVERWAWQLAKTDDAAWDFWKPRIDEYFGRVGKVTRIWEKQEINLRLLRIEHCAYVPEYLRLDGRPRDSMFAPESQVPWAPPLFRSINRLFTVSEPNVIHVFLWWSVHEDDSEETTVRGYSRSAAHGGPAVWADAYGCATLETLPDERCALLLAHEIGHAFGLQHVDDTSNLMHFGYSHADLTKEQGDRTRLEVRQQFLRAR
jgi:hypothetical protein